jgi:hypothetical protein
MLQIVRCRLSYTPGRRGPMPESTPEGEHGCDGSTEPQRGAIRATRPAHDKPNFHACRSAAQQ